MKATKVAKNLLNDKTCRTCFNSVLDDDDVQVLDSKKDTCWLHSDDLEDNYYVAFPGELTCESWENENWPDGVTKIKKGFRF